MRPKKDNIDYFSHDNDMRNDSKIKSVIYKFGLPGYSIRCMLLECLCRASGLFLLVSESEIDLLSADMYSDSNTVLPMIEFFTKIGLIQREGNKIRCNKLNERLSPVLGKRKYNEDYYQEQKESNKEKDNNNNNNRKLADKLLKDSETIVSVAETKSKKRKTPATDKNYTQDFERIWKDFPHARGGDKGETNYYYKKLNMNEVTEEVKLLKRKIKLSIQDGNYLPAAERWMKKFVKLSDSVKEQDLKNIVFKIMDSDSETRKLLAEQFIDDYGKEIADKYVKERNNKNSGITFKFKDDSGKVTTKKF